MSTANLSAGELRIRVECIYDNDCSHVEARELFFSHILVLEKTGF